MKKRNYLFEFEDLHWFPGIIRRGMTDYLRFIFSLTNIYQPVTALLADALKKTGSVKMVDLCSGGGGPLERLHINLRQQNPGNLELTLTDKFPNLAAFELLSSQSMGSIGYIKEPVDAALVPAQLIGFRTMFSAMHHFDKEMGVSILKNAVKAKTGIGIFDGGDKNIFFILLMIVSHCIGFLLLTPFIRPFCWRRFVFIYLVPIIPICTIWDGLVSITKLHTPAELLLMAAASGGNHYTWKAGKVRNKFGLNIAYLIGYPV